MRADIMAGKKAPYGARNNVPRLISAYYTHQPDPCSPGFRSSYLECSFNKAHSLAIRLAISELRKSNHAPLGGLKVVTDNGWFAARPPGTEDMVKIDVESFASEKHLGQIQAAARLS